MEQTLRQMAGQIMIQALAAVQPDAAVRSALEQAELSGRVYLIAIGKAAWQMANAAYQTLGARITDGVVITKHGHSRGAIGSLAIFEAGHPVADAASFAATRHALALTERLTAEDTVLFLGSRKGCWVRTVANADTPALWLLDMIRRAASGLPQAAGTIWQKYGRAIPADALTAQRLPDKPEPDAPIAAPRKRHRVRNALIFLLILALAAFAAAWYYTGGDLAALPQRLQSLGADSLPHAGAKLI